MPRGVAGLAARRPGDAWPPWPKRHPSQVVRLPTVTKDSVCRRQGDRHEASTRTWAPQMVKDDRVQDQRRRRATEPPHRHRSRRVDLQRRPPRPSCQASNPMLMRLDIEKAVEDVVAKLMKAKIDVKSKKDLQNVARIAANNDQEIGKIIAESNGQGQARTASSSPSRRARPSRRPTKSRGACRSIAATCRPTSSPIRRRWNAISKIRSSSSTRRKSQTTKDLVPVTREGPPAGQTDHLINSQVGGGPGLQSSTSSRGTFKCAGVKAPGYGDRRKAMLEDLIPLHQRQAIFEDLGIQAREPDPEGSGPGEEDQDRQG